ncbi:hypothetical protein HPP92_003366 [Vanilla planifolia]|uniref:Hydroxyproline-rich glycoprotein family protein n=1 Tax=Vanilla planifolia TaxID=51239 RepID=A0A835S1M9_VANPL|nr:hypothetical protein HPP92_003366 [Vanilla planifolia]
MNSSVDTVNAAAAAIVTAESRVQPDTVPRRRWNSYLSRYWCFGYHQNNKRINHAVLIPESTPPQSGLPSATHSPASGISLSALSADIYSADGRPSIFAIGPYANETQLVSPPVFSTFTTEPSTAPFTPPPESVQFTTPSSPEVPFAKLLTSNKSNSKKDALYEFHSYNPGSPIGHLISTSSVCSGTSTPFPDCELNSMPISRSKWSEMETRQATQLRGSLRNGQKSAVNHLSNNVANGSHGSEPVLDHRVSFELTAEEVKRCLGRKAIISCEAASGFSASAAKLSTPWKQVEVKCSDESVRFNETCSSSTEKPRTSITLPAAKEFKFSNSGSNPTDLSTGSDWWANEKVGGMSNGQSNWAFFSMVRHGNELIKDVCSSTEHVSSKETCSLETIA